MGFRRTGITNGVLPVRSSLFRHVMRYALAFLGVMLLEGAMLAFLTQRNNSLYQEMYSVVGNVREISTQNSVLSEMVQRCIVSGEEVPDACIAQWEKLSDSIAGLEVTETETAQLLTEDLKAYQAAAEPEFFMLMRETKDDMIELRYTKFQRRQEDRSFLCRQLTDGLTAYMGEQYPELGRKNLRLQWNFYTVFFCCALLLLFYSFAFAHSVSEPVIRLTGQAKQMMDGNYGIEDLPVEREDELGYLTRAFNEMKQRINENFTNREELWRMQTLLREAEFKALQSQVNPHFLFNVLSVATESAMVENADRTIDIIENISYMLHYSLSSVKDNTLLSDELKMVRSYLFLQGERFGRRIRYELELPDEIRPLMIPGMTLQPLVENAVRHGVEHMTRDGLIRIRLLEKEDAVEVTVSDNGAGIPADKLRKLNEGADVWSETSTGLGIANVSGRMKAFYGMTGLLHFDSREGEGTTVRITYPNRRGVLNDQGADS